MSNVVGTPVQYAPPSGVGTATIGKNEWISLISVAASAANATLQILGGPVISIPAGNTQHVFTFPAYALMGNNTNNSQAVVFTNTNSAFVLTFKAGNI